VLNYKSPYPKDKKLKEDKTIEVTPYEFWKSFIGEKFNQESEEEIIEESLETKERVSTSYDYWKSVIEEQSGPQDIGESHVVHDIVMKKRDPN